MAAKKKDRTFNSTMDEMKSTPVTNEDLADLGDDPKPDVNAGVPDWVTLPAGFRIPPGRVISFIRLKSEWTDTPNKGEVHSDGVRYRQCAVWNLNGADEKQAITRTRGDSMRLVAELTKQMCRVIDGNKADWTGRPGPGSLDIWWDEIGAKCRQLVQNHYVKTHSLTEAERADFFEHCIAVRTSA